MQIFRPGADSILRFMLGLLALGPVLVLGLVYASARTSYSTGQDLIRDQPVPFSHQHHVGGLGIDCRYCHVSVETARFAGMPPTETCMTCHSQIWTNAEMLAPVRRSLAEGLPLRWQRVYNLPGYVYFDHSVHVAKGVGCSSCHGRIDEMRLTSQAAPLTMGWCLDCHRNPAAALRARDKIFDPTWTPPKDQAERGPQLVAKYHVRIDHLTDCSVCHR
jgi:ferredoxin